MDISIVIPVYNEEESLPLIYDQIKSVFQGWHGKCGIIFVNDGSVDGSRHILKTICKNDDRVQVLSFDRNYGKTSALDAGFRLASGEIVVTMDADLQYDPSDLIRIINEFERSDADVILGRRVNSSSGFIRKVSSDVAFLTRKVFLHEQYRDSSLAGYKTECLKRLVLFEGAEVFIPILLERSGCKIKEIHVKEYPRKHGRSKYGIRNRFLKGLLTLLAVKWAHLPRLNYRVVDNI